ncbi:TonB-dependent receptor [Neolewinella aurantiaca]|uniref:TonB-dependent receptor n=1 Tax=Neolewinella aurantiaca TaxID=2602767 RepID=A0A5C7FIR3_9BACT|nr:TonB-dependent receptor [Neolewinella aurantiaca]TXF90459.1 TonB-dependent receptor [Neolewinella aurantiaca]
MHRFNLLFWVLMLSGFTALQAQNTVTGTVTDNSGETLIGASVFVEGTTTGTVTGIDGDFSLTIPGNAENLMVTYTGFETQRIPLVQGQTVYDIVLSEGVNLQEIVVSGQGVGIERKRLTTTVDVITSEQLELAPVTQLDQILQSRIPGAQIRLSSGQPGTASIIRNRGPLSANGSSTPVIIIDGVRVDNLNSNASLSLDTGGASSSALADIPVESIARVEFIRGGAATTLYGADAANGVIQIFTKKGTAGQARLSGGVLVGSMVGEEKFLRFEETADILFEPGLVQQYRLGVDGGSDKATYNFSGSFYDDDGFNDINSQRRINARFGASAKLNSKLEYNGSAAFSSNYFTRDYNANTSFARFGGIEGGNYGLINEASAGRIDTITQELRLAGELTDITEAVRRFQTSQQLTYKPFRGFTSRLILGLDSRRSRQDEIATNALLISKGAVAEGTADQGSITRATRDFVTFTSDLALGYEFDAGDFTFTTSAGAQLFRNQDEQLLLGGTNLVEGSTSFNNTAERTTTEFFRAIAFGGFYLAENIGYKNKLFLDLGTRWDFNSAFGDDIGLINLKRIGLRYSLTDEAFMQTGSISNIVTRASFRANYGEASNFPTPFARDQVFNSNAYFGLPAYTFGNPGNSELGPEIVKSLEFGGDFSFLRGRIGVNVTYYNTITEDAIFTPAGLPSSGQLAQEANVGEIENKGWEFETNFSIVETKDVDFTVSASLTTNENTVTDAGGSPEFSVGGFTFLGSFVAEGQPLGYLRGALATIDENGEFSAKSNSYLGKPNPDGYGTVGFNLRYKRFNLFASSDYQYGAQGVAVDDVLRYFSGVEDEGRIPEEAAAQAGSFFDLAGYWVEDTDFLKVRNVGLSYNVPVENSTFSYLKIGFNMRNPFIFASSSFDPEVTGAGIGSQGGFAAGGFGYGTESAPKQYLFSIDFGF